MAEFLNPGANWLLGHLTVAEQRRLFAQFELVMLKAGAVLCEPYEPLRFAYFPVDCVISVACETQDGDSAECEVVGNEGVFGTALLLGGVATPRRATVQCGGRAYRLAAPSFMAEFSLFGNMHDLMLRYLYVAFTQASQIALCNRHHTVEQQLCRWLLFLMDRTNARSVNITHQRIADMLGVRREGVTLATRKLQEGGVISCQRGAIAVCQRSQLEYRSCECYEVVKKEMERLTQSRSIGAAKLA